MRNAKAFLEVQDEFGSFDAYIWGWGGDPDPDFILSIFKSSQCGIWSDGCYNDPAYDKMWEQQHYELDPEKRTQEINAIIAHLSDRWRPFFLTAIFTGMVLALQSYYALVTYGASESLGLLVNLSLVRELGPVLVGLMIAARVTSSIAAGHFWARSRNIKFLRHIHRLDAGTTGFGGGIAANRDESA